MNLLLNRNRLKVLRTKLWLPKVKPWGSRIVNQPLRINIHMLLHITRACCITQRTILKFCDNLYEKRILKTM